MNDDLEYWENKESLNAWRCKKVSKRKQKKFSSYTFTRRLGYWKVYKEKKEFIYFGGSKFSNQSIMCKRNDKKVNFNDYRHLMHVYTRSCTCLYTWAWAKI